MAVQEHLHFVQPAREAAFIAGEFAIHAPAGDGRQRFGRVVDRFVEAEIPAARGGDVKASDVGEGFVQCADEGNRFVVVDIEGTGIGKHDAFVVKAQVDRVGAQPMAIARSLAQGFAKQAQGGERHIARTEQPGEGDFESLFGLALEAGAACQPFEARHREFPEGQLVVRFRPDQFGDKQGKVHGKRSRVGQGEMSPKSVPWRLFTSVPYEWHCPTNC